MTANETGMKNLLIPFVLFALGTGCITTREANPCHPAGDPDRCADWLEFHQESREQLAQRACVRGSDKACLLTARPSKSFLEKMCGKNIGVACFKLAEEYGESDEAMPQFKKACELNEARACSKLAKSSESPEKEKFAARACELGLDEECDSKTPPKVLESNCLKGSAQNCTVLGALLLGQGKALEAKRLFDKACRTDSQGVDDCRLPEIHASCTEGNLPSCDQLLQMGDPTGDSLKHFEAGLRSHLTNLDPASDETLLLVTKACELGFERFCRHLSVEQRCRDGHSDACLEWASDQSTEEGSRKALWAFEQMCQHGDKNGCLRLGYFHLAKTSHYGVRVSFVDAVKAFARSCELGELSACGPSKTYDGVLERCEKGDDLACYAAYEVLYFSSPDGEERARQIVLSQCQRGVEEACNDVVNMRSFSVDMKTLAWNTLKKRWGRKPPAWVSKLTTLKNACDHANAQACYDLYLIHQNSEVAAAQYLKKACDGNLLVACATYARFIWLQDWAKALELIEKSCESKATVCGEFAVKLLGNQEYASSIRLLERACQANDGDSCNQLARLLNEGVETEGWTLPTDPKRAKDLFEKACKLGEKSACEALGY